MMDARSTSTAAHVPSLPPVAPLPRTWDGRLARRLVVPLVGTWVTPNHLTTLRLVVGLAGVAGLGLGSYSAANLGAFLIALSNFIDHTDGELARISGQSSRFGHLYDLACDAFVTIALFTALGFGAAGHRPAHSSSVLGLVSGVAITLIFFVRMRIEAQVGKAGTRQSCAAGFEVEDVLYLLPLVTLFGVASPFVLVAAVGATLYAIWSVIAWSRVARRPAGAALSS